MFVSLIVNTYEIWKKEGKNDYLIQPSFHINLWATTTTTTKPAEMQQKIISHCAWNQIVTAFIIMQANYAFSYWMVQVTIKFQCHFLFWLNYKECNLNWYFFYQFVSNKEKCKRNNGICHHVPMIDKFCGFLKLKLIKS